MRVVVRRPVRKVAPVAHSIVAAPARVRRTARRRVLGVSCVLLAAVALVLCVSVSVGDFPIPLREVVPAIFGRGDEDAAFIVRTLRLPRALCAVLVGAAFGLSGAIFQSVARNPLASPDIIGVTAGATTVAVFLIVVVGAGSVVVSLAAFAGALGAALLVYALAYRGGVASSRLVLVGIGISAELMAVTSYLLTRAAIFDAQRATVWLAGSLDGRGWEHVRPITVALVVLLPAAVVLSQPLRALQLVDDTARALGVPIERARLALLVVGVALAAVATAAAGPVAFVAFVSPAIARRLTGATTALVPSALAGALLLGVSDLLARRAFAPIELPVGIVTGVIGGPYLLWLLARAHRTGRAG
jgi:iron complex transport system permease protein